MSRRLPTSPLVRILLLLFLGTSLTPFLAVPAAAFGERPFEWNQTINGTNHLDVYSSESVAQSFVATDAYRLLNVTLRFRNRGDTTDTVTVALRADAAGVPADTDFARAQIVIGNTVVGNYNVPFGSPPALAAGTRYWIVATCSSLLSNGYEWHHSGADVFPGGQAKINLNLGGGWINPATPTDMYFLTFGQEIESNLTTTIVATRTNVNAGDLVTFHAYLNNSGATAAPTAWLNDTQLPGFGYVSDTAQAAGASTPWPSFRFDGVGNGPRTFDLIARVQIGTEPGTVLTKALTLRYIDGAGTLRVAPSTQASVLVGKQTKQVYLNPDPVGSSERLRPGLPAGGPGSQYNETLQRDDSAHDFDLAPALARAFRIYGTNATLYLDSATHDAKNLDINLTLSDWNGVTLTPLAYVQRRMTTNNFADYQPFTFTFPVVNRTFPAGGRIRLTVRNMGTGSEDAILAMNSTFAASRLDLDTSTYVRIDLLDLRDANGSPTAWSPKDTLVVRANVSDPFGSAEISAVRVNLTSPSGSLVVNYTAMALLATDPATPSAWKLFQFAYGPPLSEGTYVVDVTAVESNGVTDLAEADAVVRAPQFTLAKTTTASNVGSGDKFTYDIWYNNTGTGTAGRVWINDSLPNELTFLSSSDPGAMTGSYNWTWTSLATGPYVLSIHVQVKGGLPPTPYARNYAFLNYTDEKGYLWPVQLAYADVVFHGPVISLSKTSSKSAIHANETIVYTVTMQNAGETAQALWLNDTLPTELGYVSDSSNTIPGSSSTVSGNDLYFRFSNMPALTTWSFTVTAVGSTAIEEGAEVTNAVSLNYTNSNGYFLPPKDASWTVIARAPRITSAFVTIVPTQATPSDVIPAVVLFTNSGNEAARDAWMNLTIDPGLAFLNASLPATVSGVTIRFYLTNVGFGLTLVYLNLSIRQGVQDHQSLPVNGTIAYSDAFRNVLPVVFLLSDSVEASVPRMVLSVAPQQSWVEAGTIGVFSIYQVNAGSGVAGDVWLTLPLPSSFIYDSDTADVTPTAIGSTYTWHWTNIAPGPKSFSLQLRAKPSVLNGTLAVLNFRTDFTDANGNPHNTTLFPVSARIRAPQVALIVAATPSQARPGDTIRYDLTFRNTGNATMRNLWLVDVLDPRFEFVSYAARVPVSGQNPLNWSYVDVAPGATETVTLVLRIRGDASIGALIPNTFEAVFTNSAGTVIGYARSDSPTVLIQSDPFQLAYIGSGIAAVGLLAAFVVMRRLQVHIEEVFLVYRDGVLIYHLSRSLTQDNDEDVLSGMLTAVQDFVRDAFRYGEHRELHHLDFGDYRILIERGKDVYLAVVYSGKDTGFVRKRVRSVIDRIEAVYGPVLAKWDGDMDKVVGTRDVIREHLLKTNGHARPSPPL